MPVISVGVDCPNFTARDQDDKEVKSSAFKGKTVVLYFYPKDDTPGCTVEAQEFRDAVKEFEKKNTLIYGVSKDSCGSHQNFIKKYGLNFPLLADEHAELYSLFGISGRTTVLVGPDGKVKHVFEKVTPKGHAAQVCLSACLLYSSLQVLAKL